MEIKKDVGPDSYHVMDIYNDSPDAINTIIMVHGGGWHFQSKSSMVGIAHVFAEQNYRVVCVSYPLLSFSCVQLLCILAILTLLLVWLCIESELLWIWVIFLGVISDYHAHHPWLTVRDQVEAIKVQIQWLQLKKKCIFLGYSCGAHLATMVAIHTHQVVESCVLISGVYDRKVLCEIWGGRQLCYAGVDEFPTDYATPTKDIRFLFLNASIDLNLKKQTHVYYHKLKDAGLYVRARVIPHTNHWTVHRQWGVSRAWVRDYVLDFIKG
jgi:acetyl esterase/lipase